MLASSLGCLPGGLLGCWLACFACLVTGCLVAFAFFLSCCVVRGAFVVDVSHSPQWKNGGIPRKSKSFALQDNLSGSKNTFAATKSTSQHTCYSATRSVKTPLAADKRGLIRKTTLEAEDILICSVLCTVCNCLSFAKLCFSEEDLGRPLAVILSTDALFLLCF